VRTLTCLMLGIALTIPSARLHSQGQPEYAAVPPPAAKLVIPILNALEKAQHEPRPIREEKGSPLWTAGTLTGNLIQNKSHASDEALVVLLYYYLGEANGEDQTEEILARGKKMLPYLKKYESHSPRIPGKRYDEILLAPETVKESFSAIIDQIQKDAGVQ
jgi:hypothetical protein